MISEYDPERGIIRLPRAHLEAIVGGRPEVLDNRDPLGSLLAETGFASDRGLDPALRPVLSALRRPAARFGLRTQQGDAVRRHRGWIGATGVVTITGGVAATDVQDVRVTARPTAVNRVLAPLLGLGPARPVPDLPAVPLTWEDVLAPVRQPGAGWAAASLGPAPLHLSHLRWSGDGVRRATTALLLLGAGADGLVEAVPTDDGYRLESRSSTALWTMLCALTATG